MIATTVTTGEVNWEAALAVPGAFDLAMDGLTATDETLAALENAYPRYVGRLSLAGVSDEQLEGLAEAGIKLAKLRSGEANGDRQVRFRRLLKEVAGELRKLPGFLSMDGAIASVQQTLGEVEKDIQDLRAHRLGKAKDRFRRLLMKKTALKELERDLLLLQAWITKEKFFDIEPLVRRILSSDPFRQLKGKATLLREELIALCPRQTIDEATDIDGLTHLFQEAAQWGQRHQSKIILFD